jgi:hypothetical protein
MHCNSLLCVRVVLRFFCILLCYIARVAIRKRRSAPESRALAPGNDSQLVVRLPAALVKRVDQFAESMRAELPGTRFARAEAVRVLLTRALNQGHAKAKP